MERSHRPAWSESALVNRVLGTEYLQHRLHAGGVQHPASEHQSGNIDNWPVRIGCTDGEPTDFRLSGRTAYIWNHATRQILMCRGPESGTRGEGQAFDQLLLLLAQTHLDEGGLSPPQMNLQYNSGTALILCLLDGVGPHPLGS